MGTSVAVTFSCIYISMMETECMKKCKSQNPNFQGPEIYKRFIDDCFSYWKIKSDAELFAQIFNESNAHIKITQCISDQEGIFLDIKVFKDKESIAQGKLETILFQKEANKYQYLPADSFHPKHIFKSFITSELQRYLIKCSKFEDFNYINRLFYIRLTARGYQSNYLHDIFKVNPSNYQEWRTLRNSAINKIINPNSNNKPSFPTVYKTTFNPIHKLININKIITPEENSIVWFDMDWHKITPKNKIIIAYKNNPTIGQLFSRTTRTSTTST
jgi:hypothetical protein